MRAARLCGVASRALDGGGESGDRCLIEPFAGGAFIAVIDALGHGAESAQTAATALNALKRQADEGVDGVMARCHERMRRTRGAAIGLALLDWRRRRLSWLGVGSIAGTLCRRDAHGLPASVPLLVRSGIVGDRLPALRPLQIDIAAGDTLVLATDGVRADFISACVAGEAPQALAERILRDFGKADDDALALVVRCPDTAD